MIIWFFRCISITNQISFISFINTTLLNCWPLVSLRCITFAICTYREKYMQIHLIYRIAVKSCIHYFLYFFFISNDCIILQPTSKKCMLLLSELFHKSGYVFMNFIKIKDDFFMP